MNLQLMCIIINKMESKRKSGVPAELVSEGTYEDLSWMRCTLITSSLICTLLMPIFYLPFPLMALHFSFSDHESKL